MTHVWVHYDGDTGIGRVHYSEPASFYGMVMYDVGPIELDQAVIDRYMESLEVSAQAHADFVRAVKEAPEPFRHKVWCPMSDYYLGEPLEDNCGCYCEDAEQRAIFMEGEAKSVAIACPKCGLAIPECQCGS